MDCEEAGCLKRAVLICSLHLIKFCEKHYGRHCRVCKNKAIDFDPSKEICNGQIRDLQNNIALIKSKIIGVASELVLSIENSLKKSLFCLDQRKVFLIDIIHKCKPENQINELLSIVPNTISLDLNLVQRLADIEQIFSLEEFEKKVQELENKWMRKEIFGKC